MMKYPVVIILIILIFANKVFAEQLAFDRLFSTPDQREELDSSRERLIQGLDTPEQVEEESEVVEKINNATTLQELLLPRAKFNGLVIRENGRADYWVNGKSTRAKNDLAKELKNKTHHHGTRLTLDIAKGERINLYPGEVFSFERERKFQGYEDPHLAKGVEVKSDVSDELKESQEAEAIKAEELAAKPTEVFDESFLIKEIQKIQLLEQRLQELEIGKPEEE